MALVGDIAFASADNSLERSELVLVLESCQSGRISSCRLVVFVGKVLKRRSERRSERPIASRLPESTGGCGGARLSFLGQGESSSRIGSFFAPPAPMTV